jgi:glycerophosphoryl diester phosphodiesterase
MNNLNLLLNLPIAHRGLHNDLIPENTISAIASAFNNYFNCEIDVRLTNDNKVIVFHDDSLLRLCGIDKLVHDLTFEEIKNCKISKSNETIPLLTDVLKIIPNNKILLIELKNMNSPGTLEELVLEEIKNYYNKVSLQSFNPFTITWFKRKTRNIPVGFITSDFQDEELNVFKKFFLTRKLLVNYIKPDFLSADIDINPQKISFYKKLDIPILTWTIDSFDKFEKSKDFSNNIIFEKIIPYSYDI